MDWTIMGGSSRSSAAQTALNVASPRNCLVRMTFCPVYQTEPSVVPCERTRTLSPPLSRAQIFLFLWTVGLTDLWATEEDSGATKVKKPGLSASSHLWHWQKKFSSIASSSAAAAACLCCCYVFGFAPKQVRKISVLHKSGVQRLDGGWLSAGLLYCPHKSAGKTLPPLLRIKAKTDLSGSNDGKSWAKPRAFSVLMPNYIMRAIL